MSSCLLASTLVVIFVINHRREWFREDGRLDEGLGRERPPRMVKNARKVEGENGVLSMVRITRAWRTARTLICKMLQKFSEAYSLP